MLPAGRTSTHTPSAVSAGRSGFKPIRCKPIRCKPSGLLEYLDQSCIVGGLLAFRHSAYLVTVGL